MLKKVTLYAGLAYLAMIGPLLAQTVEQPNNVHMPPVIEQPRVQIAARPTQALLAEISTWLSSNFDLPVVHDYPRVEFVPPAKLVAIRYKGIVPDRISNDPAAQTNYQRDVLAVYNDSAKTIFLSEGWKGTNVADLSVLVHEMVHHLQNLAGLKYECTPAREKLAYQAQDQWLKLHGRNLEQEFEIDMLTILVSSACMN